ncbi:winged helix-turn-helix domain-containing protein [uncultured Tenacibaculum sp.]|uniref:winged helix-turn-helix domain-containing protein n=1 Tax=uncultured Tenacibaculum sp. TaxID=174713 RepID=UPI0026345E75|nr:LysR family transcriptional regulator [uncultured Tenacibaculum sp.]
MNYKIKSRIWIEVDDRVFLGEGRIQLLKAIDEVGSLSKAAKALQLSYKKAWHLLNSMNTSGKQHITTNSIGGKGGGGTQLTEYGRDLIKIFDQINKNCWSFLDQELEALKKLDEEK